jgi:cystathionine beta-lyase
LEKKVSYEFTTSACRENTNAEKYTLRKTLFFTDDVTPVWVADMDIDTPDFVLDSLKLRLKHPILGYEELPHSAKLAQKNWMIKHHGLEYDIENIFYSHSVVASMNVAIEAFSNTGDGVIVQTPVYPPFFHSVLNHDRKLLKNSLKQLDDGSYIFDIENFKSLIDEKTKLLLLCSPHNPVGRVWKKEELEQILQICKDNNIIVFSDEIHSDLIYEPNKHIPFSSLNGAKDITITAFGVGKTFNMAGFAISTVLVENDELKTRFKKVYEKIHFAQGNVLSHVAFESAYTLGDKWRNELLVHLKKNYDSLKNLLDNYSEYIKLTPIEATYLAWLDCRGMKLNDKTLRKFFVQEAKLGLNSGISFGREGSKFMRLNFAVSSLKMSQVIKQLEKALKKFHIDSNNE